VEPEAAAGIASSVRAGTRVAAPTGETIMAGLNCATPSALAWPVLLAGLDAAVTIGDDEARAAAPVLRAGGVDAGPCGWAAAAGALAALRGDGSGERREWLGVDGDAVVVLLTTEGAEANPAR
jgi:diaminopropionate ammonia-lyase